MSMLAVTLLFCISALCNQCSFSNLISSTATVTDTELDKTDVGTSEEDTHLEEVSEAEGGEETDISEHQTESLIQPITVKISVETLRGTEMVFEELGDNFTAIGKNIYQFLIEATSEGDETFTFDARCSGGRIIDGGQLDNNHAWLAWSSETTGNFELTFLVHDSSGNETTRILNINVNEIAQEFNLEPYQALCGHLVQSISTIYVNEENVLVGDDGCGRQVKGYISFNISDLSSNPSIEVLIAHFICTGSLDISGDLHFANKLDIKAFDYGNSLDVSDFEVGGSFLIDFPVDNIPSYGLSFSNLPLINAINAFIDNSETYFQIKLGFDIPADTDTVIDGIWIPINNLSISGLYH